MAKDPAFLFYPQDFIMGTLHFTKEQKGIYIDMLCFQHQHGGIISKEIFENFIGEHNIIRSKFIKTEEGFYNKRLMEEMVKRERKSNNLSSNAKKRWGKQCKSNAKASDLHMPIENENENENVIVIKNIIEDINIVLSTKYKVSSKKTKDLIKARLNEGFTLEDFKTVHRKMLRAWGADEKMCKYLRPVTLYGPKFESYLNMKEPTTKLTESGIKAYLVGQAWLKKQEVIDVK